MMAGPSDRQIPTRGGPPKRRQNDPDPIELRDVTGSSCRTNTTNAMLQIDAHAEKFKDESETADDFKLRNGLRLGFGALEDGCEVVTNYLELRPPPVIHVYSIESIRERVEDKKVLVRKFEDRMKILDILKTHLPGLRKNQKKWVSDGDLIWSTEKLFDADKPSQKVVKQLKKGRDGIRLEYHNECGYLLEVEEVNISYHLEIRTDQSHSELFSDAGTTAQRKSNPGILLRGLNAFLTAYARSCTDTNTFTSGNKAFFRDDQKQISLSGNQQGEAAVRALRGFFLSARPGVESLLVNINTTSSAFFGLQNVEDFLSSPQYKRRSAEAKTALLKGTKVEIVFPPSVAWPTSESANRFVHAVGEHISIEKCHKKAGQDVTVERCFLGDDQGCPSRLYVPKGEATVNGSHAVKVATSMLDPGIVGRMEWYPAEWLRIVEDQPFHNALNAGQTSKMLKFALKSPNENYSRIMNDGLRMFGFTATNQSGLSTFHQDLEAGQQMIKVPGCWLKPPTIRFQSSIKTPEHASWDLMNVKFAEVNKKLPCLPWINLSEYDRKDRTFDGVLKTLRAALRNHGLLSDDATFEFQQKDWQKDGIRNPRTIATPEANPGFEQKVEEVLAHGRSQENKTAPTLITIDQYDQELYAYIKRVAELKLGVRTILLKANTTDKNGQAIQVGPNAQHGSNVALKYNIKLQQKCYTLDRFAGHHFREVNKKDGTKTTCIVIGADVTHPGKGSPLGTPSIAAVVGSVDGDFMHFPGSMRLQRSRKEPIVELGDMVKERLLDWAAKNNWRLPENVLFYRDGVSESQYAKLRAYEIPQLDKAFNWAREYIDRMKGNSTKGTKGGKGGKGGKGEGGGGTKQTPLGPTTVLDPERHPWPKVANPVKKDQDEEDQFDDKTGNEETFNLTYVVVGKRHNTRFYATKEEHKIVTTNKDGEKKINHNVKPGLVVDQVITHPHSFDFYLQSHNPITGTGRSAHYFVLQNYMDLSAEDLQDIVSLHQLTPSCPATSD